MAIEIIHPTLRIPTPRYPESPLLTDLRIIFIIMSLCLVVASVLFMHRVVHDLRHTESFTWAPSLSLIFIVLAWLTLDTTYWMMLWSYLGQSPGMFQKSRMKNLSADKWRLKYQSMWQFTFNLYVPAGFVGTTSLWLTKASFISMYFSLVGCIGRRMRIALYVSAVVVALSYFGAVLPFFWWCGTDRMLEDILQHRPYCTPTIFFIDGRFLTIFAVFNTVSDAIVIVVPVLIMRHQFAHRGLSTTMAFLFLLVLGLLIIGVTIIRTVLITRRSHDAEVAKNWELRANEISTSELLAFAEESMALFAACLPAVRAAVNEWASRRSGGRMKDIELEIYLEPSRI